MIIDVKAQGSRTQAIKWNYDKDQVKEYERENNLREDNKNMKITDVRIRKTFNEGKVKAIASVTIDDAFVVHDIKVIERQEGIFIAMPSKKTPNGEFKDTAHPINPEVRKQIQNAIIEALNLNNWEQAAESEAE